MRKLSLLALIVLILFIAGVTMESAAQCFSAQLFRSAGFPGNNVVVSAEGVDPERNEIGRFWDSDDAMNSHNGLEGPDFGNLCPAELWWKLRPASGNWAIDGALTEGTCAQTGCPENELTIVVEDYDWHGAPGIGDTAYYVAWKTNATPVSDRWFDYGGVDGVVGNTVFPMRPFPELQITSSARMGPSVSLTVNMPDQATNVHTWDWEGGAPYPMTDVIKEWQLVRFIGLNDPGRLRSHGWEIFETIPYVPGGTSIWVTTQGCSDTVSDEYLAVAIGFDGGNGQVIDSALVGRAVTIECDPNLTQPDPTEELDRKRDIGRPGGKPGRSGGRR